ncbi:uncharacterized protein LOC109862489 [Pseudomyrmex gracilis]|uniref:uncharacterized protein LOC109862489 n=1 Tax=Pseudomyrmex gracilis TaxID=219809 RepID=UPI000995D0BD|nr:uncharacterized protein LOC109862489 [Pseudomyrmex gracilis]
MDKFWGIKLNTALRIYKAVLVPSLTYAAVVWWPRVKKMESKNLLKSLQSNYLRAATGTMKTTPTEALEIALCIPLLNLTIISAARLTAYRLRCQGEWRNFGRDHTRLGFFHKPLFTLKQDKISGICQVVKTFSINLTRLEGQTGKTEIFRSSRAFRPGSLMDLEQTVALERAYTVQDQITGSRSFWVGWPRSFKRKYWPFWNVQDSYYQKKKTKKRRINIYTDSKAAIEALAKTTTESSVVWDCMQALNSLGERNSITLVWVRGHQGIQGNGMADSLAKLNTLEEPACQRVGVSFAIRKNHIKDWLKREHRTAWVKLKSCRQAKVLMTQPLPGRTKELLTMGKYKQRLCIGLLTRHWAFRAHLFNLGLVEESRCRFCGEEREDSVHILFRCPSLVLKRFKSLGSMFVEPEDLKIHNIGHLCSLAANAGLKQPGR